MWIPLFPYLDYGALPAAAGTFFGAICLRKYRGLAERAAGTLGIIGGLVGLALQGVWMAVYYSG